jgi:hypothetical protein
MTLCPIRFMQTSLMHLITFIYRIYSLLLDQGQRQMNGTFS